MKAVVNTRYGSPDVLEIRRVPKSEPDAGEVLVRVHATTVTRTDAGLLRARPFIVRCFMGFSGMGFFRPGPKHRIRGMDFAGEVEAVGAGVESFAPGDRVFGMSADNYGAHAEYLCMPENGAIGPIPAGLSFAEAVVCEGAWYAHSSLQAFGLGPGHSILIYGASGAIGSAAVQLAKSRGAEVTAVVATRHLELARSLGADRVVDYKAGDFTEIGESFDFVLDAVGKVTYFRCRKLLKPGGTFASTDLGPWYQNPLLALWSSITRSRRVIFPMPGDTRASFDFLSTCMDNKEFRAVIDRKYALEAIAEAYRYVETGQKTGIVVIDVGSACQNANAQRPPAAGETASAMAGGRTNADFG